MAVLVRVQPVKKIVFKIWKKMYNLIIKVKQFNNHNNYIFHCSPLIKDIKVDFIKRRPRL